MRSEEHHEPPGLTLRFLGPPEVEANGETIEVGRLKALALLIYLAVTGEGHHRNMLATLLWPESTQARARASLRRDLSILKAALGGDWLETEGETVRLKRAGLRLDVAQFRRKLAQSRRHGHADDAVCAACLHSLAEAVALYRDDFLAGFSPLDAPGFDEWQFFEAEALRRELASALERLVHGYTVQGTYDEAIPYARRWLALDRLHEPAHRALMELYAHTDQRAAALRQYQVCVDILEDELGIGPAAETTALFKEIQRASGAAERRERSHSARPGAGPRLHNFPAPVTPFVGRVEALAEVVRRLQDPTYRLLTLAGPGGIGKTRLAIQAARTLGSTPLGRTGFADGIYFVPLISAGTPGQLSATIANALGFSFYRQSNPTEQLLDHMREKELLLVIDSFEQVIAGGSGAGEEEIGDTVAGGAGLVAAILGAAADVKMLVTSREALRLREEWVYPIWGMRCPPAAADTAGRVPGGIEGYSAVKLFAQSARQVRPDFTTTEHLDCVLRICHLVEGIPLAIELAATWLNVLACDEIAARIEHSLDILTTTWRNVPERHRSMRAVFEHSWKLLSRAEQETLARLSLFRGGFRQEAAAAVAGASLPVLAALIEKSMLWTTDDGRYQLHELLRQFAAEKLGEDEQVEETTLDLHRDYFLRFLQEWQHQLRGETQQAALRQIRQEIGNIRLAWQRASGQGEVEAIGRVLDGLYYFFRTSSRFQQGADTFRETTEQMRAAGAPELLLLRLTTRLGALYLLLGVPGSARELLQESVSRARRLEADDELAFALNMLGNVANMEGQNDQAERLYRESLNVSRAVGDRRGTARSLYNLGRIALGAGRYREARSLFRESLALQRAVGNRAGVAYCLDSLGMTAFYLGEYAAAERDYQDSLAIFNELGDRFGSAKALGGLGLVAWGVGGARLPEAEQQFRESLQITRAIGHRVSIAERLAFSGSIANSQGNYERARHFLREALAISRKLGFAFGISWSLAEMGNALLGQARPEAACERFREALAGALESQDTPIVLYAMVSLAGLLIAESAKGDAWTPAGADPGPDPTDREQIVEMLALVTHHPASWQVIKDRAGELLGEIEGDISGARMAAAVARGRSTRLIEMVLALLTEESGCR